MRKIEQKLLIGLADAVTNGLEQASDGKIPADTAAAILEDCFSALATMEHAAGRNVSGTRCRIYQTAINRLKDIFSVLKENLAVRKESEQKWQVDAHMAGSWLVDLKNELIGEKEIRYVIVFLPYKASMWDSMDTIWESAVSDSRCIVYTVPIPYFDRNPDRSFGQMHYEGDLFPEYVPVTDYRCMNLGDLRPDAVYIHNPYDEYNYVTSIAPEFYSRELKKYTDHLVYVSYFIPGVYKSAEDAAAFCQTTGMFYADIIIAQSQIHKALLAANGNRQEKIAVLGNPKLDYIMKRAESVQIPDEWVRRLSGRKKVLLCMSIGSFLLWDNMIEMYDAFIDYLLNQYQSAVLFRPHPLLEQTIRTMRPEKIQRYETFLNKYSNKEGFVLDGLADSAAAIYFSECMIGDYSSLCFSYAVTGKPTAVLVYRSLPADNLYYAFDYRGSYFIRVYEYLEYKKLPQDFIDFIKDFMNNEDPKKKERLKRIGSSVVNADGTSGQRIHQHVMGQISIID